MSKSRSHVPTSAEPTMHPEPFKDYMRALTSGRLKGVPHRARNTSEVQRIRRFLIDRYAGATTDKTRVYGGQVFDFFPYEEQPALRGKKVKASKLPPPGKLKQVGPKWSTPEKALRGHVPIRRLSLADMVRPGTYDRFMQKHGVRSRSLLRKIGPNAPQDGDDSHRWASVHRNVSNVGGSAVLSIWKPQLAEGQTFSLSQIWVVAEGQQGVQTVEVGWHVDPEITGHDDPAMFCYWTANNYQYGSQHYNGYNHEFVYKDNRPVILGLPITDFSSSAGNQKDVYVAVRYNDGAWWVYIGGDQNQHAIGYYPCTLFEGGPLADGKAAEVEFGGEVCGGPPFAPMGSGALAGAGGNGAAYQRQLNIVAPDGTDVEPLDLMRGEAVPGEYSVELGFSAAMGDFIYFGGPGGSS